MRVGIDATELRPGAVGGVRTALWLLLDALHRHAPEIEVTALAPGPVEAPKGVTVVATGGPTRPRRWRRSRALGRTLRGLDLFHSPVTAIPELPGPPMTATVHELPFVVDHRLEGPRRAFAQWWWLSRAMGRCAALVAPSPTTLRQMCQVHPALARIAHVVPHAAPPPPSSEQKDHDGSLLFVGRLDRRKCVEALLAGAVGFKGQIRLAGPHAAERRLRVDEIAWRLGIADRVLHLGVVDEETLDYLYRHACVVALVSASEGFGFPVLEALARGVPVIVAEGTGAADTGGTAVLRVDPRDPEQIAAALRRAADPEWRHHVATEGPGRALGFSAERAARGYAEVFRRAVAR